jgi:hypothetical protein
VRARARKRLTLDFCFYLETAVPVPQLRQREVLKQKFAAIQSGANCSFFSGLLLGRNFVIYQISFPNAESSKAAQTATVLPRECVAIFKYVLKKKAFFLCSELHRRVWRCQRYLCCFGDAAPLKPSVSTETHI